MILGIAQTTKNTWSVCIFFFSSASPHKPNLGKLLANSTIGAGGGMLNLKTGPYNCIKLSTLLCLSNWFNSRDTFSTWLYITKSHCFGNVSWFKLWSADFLLLEVIFHRLGNLTRNIYFKVMYMHSVPGRNFWIPETTHQLKKGNLTYKAR